MYRWEAPIRHWNTLVSPIIHVSKMLGSAKRMEITFINLSSFVFLRHVPPTYQVSISEIMFPLLNLNPFANIYKSWAPFISILQILEAYANTTSRCTLLLNLNHNWNKPIWIKMLLNVNQSFWVRFTGISKPYCWLIPTVGLHDHCSPLTLIIIESIEFSAPQIVSSYPSCLH